jgi:O-acetyl-ADP-ribose deacetylase (regulator of RNase III)
MRNANKKTVFISHSSKDDTFVDKLILDLQSSVHTWVDHREMRPGQHWDSEVAKALEFCDSMIAVISENSIGSRNCQDEWHDYIERGREIIPLWLSGSRMYFRLGTSQYVDFRKNYRESLKKLIGYLTDNHTNVPTPRLAESRNRPLHARLFRRYPLARKASRYIGIATGNIAEIAGADVLVNSENTHLEMDNFTGESVSAIINLFGAKRDERGQVVEKTIENELRAAHVIDGPAAISTVLVTKSGALSKAGIRHIVHAITVTRGPDGTYVPGTKLQLGRCVTRVLSKIDDLNNEHYGQRPLKTVVFPIFGTGRGGLSIKEVVPTLLERAIDHLETQPTRIETAYFVAYKQKHFDDLRSIIESFPDLESPEAGE